MEHGPCFVASSDFVASFLVSFDFPSHAESLRRHLVDFLFAARQCEGIAAILHPNVVPSSATDALILTNMCGVRAPSRLAWARHADSQAYDPLSEIRVPSRLLFMISESQGYQQTCNSSTANLKILASNMPLAVQELQTAGTKSRSRVETLATKCAPIGWRAAANARSIESEHHERHHIRHHPRLCVGTGHL
jgi:hypothetical protein